MCRFYLTQFRVATTPEWVVTVAPCTMHWLKQAESLTRLDRETTASPNPLTGDDTNTVRVGRLVLAKLV